MPRPGNFIVLNPNSSDRYTPLDSFSRVLEDDIDDAVTESEPDAEEEIDQLDSDSDAAPEQQQQQQQPDAPVAPKKPPPSRSGERRPGQTLLPTVRIENILQAEGMLGNLSLSKEGIFLLSVATEEFIRRLVKAGHQRASQQSRNMVRYHDMATVARDQYEFRFLQETIPTPRTLSSAFTQRNKRERELLKDDPAMQFHDVRGQTQQTPSSQVVVTNGRHTEASEPSPLPDVASISGSSSSTGLKPPQPARTSMPHKSYSSATVIPKELAPPGAVDSLEPSPPPDGASSSSSTSSTSKVQARTSSRARMPYPAKERLAESAAKRRAAESTETWEEWKEKSRRLYGTGDNSRLKNSSSSSTLNGTSSSHSTLPRDPSDIPPLAPESRLGPDPPPMVVPTHGPHLPPPATMGPLTGPGSAFLQGPGGPFPRPPPPTTTPPTHSAPAASTSPPAAPVHPSGRTIYSTDSHVENDD